MNIINYNENGLTVEQAKAGCLVLNMPNEAYHAFEGISKSGLDLVNRSPAHYLLGVKFEPSPTMRMGTIVHAAILEPERFATEFICLAGVNDKRKSEYKEAVKVHGAENVLIEKEAAQVASLQESIANSDTADDLAACDLFEVSAFIEVDGILLRCRYDALNTADHVCIDLKTTKCSERTEFSKSVFNYRYHVQDVFYSSIYKLITGHDLTFKFLAVENEPPHCPMIYTLDDDAKAIGKIEAERNLEQFAEAMESNDWQGYEKSDEPLMLPGWAIAMYEEQLEGLIS